MSRIWLLAPLLALSIAAPPAVSADDDKLASLIKDYGSISQGLHKAQQTQATLLRQKGALDAQGANLSARQQGLNAETQVHTSVAVQEQKDLDAKQEQCGRSGSAGAKGALPHAAGCGSASKKLGKMTLAVNVGGKLEENQQTLLDLEFGQYTQAANDWTARENQNITAMNALYGSLNEWADRADYYMRSGPFRDEVQASHAGKACTQRKLPDGTLSMEALQRYSADAESCLRYVATRRKPPA